MKAKIWLWFRRGLLALLVLATLLVIAWTVADGWTGAKLREEMRLSREAGFPLTPADIRLEPVAEAENAAPVYREIRTLLEREDPRDRVEAIGQAVSNEEMTAEEKRETIRSHWNGEIGRVLDLTKEAAARPRFDADLDFSQGADVAYQHLSHLRRLVRLVMAAWLIAEPEDRAELLVPMIRPATHLLEEPTFVSLRTR